MRSTRPYVIALLALSSVALGGLSWQQYQEIIRLRAAVLENSTKANRPARTHAKAETPAELPEAAPAAAAEAAKPADNEDGPPEPGDRGRGRKDDRMAAMRAVMNSPEFQKLAQLTMNGQTEARFADLFKKLNLPPEALEKFKTLLAEKQMAARDAMEVAREQGLNGRENRDQVRSLIKQTQAEIDENIRSAIGDTAFNQYQQYEQTQPQRGTANQLTQRLSYSGSPLTDSQYEQFVQTLASTGGTKAGGEGRNFMGGPGGFGGGGPVAVAGFGGVAITPEVVTQASAYLTTPQLNALQRMQAEQEAARKMRDALQAARQGNKGKTTPPATTSAGGPP